MQFGVKITRNDLESFAAGKLGAKVRDGLALGMQRLLLQAEREVAMQIRPGASLTPRSGMLAKSWTSKGGAEFDIETGETRVTGRLGSVHPAARIQEEGGPVSPARAKMLAIPLGAAKTAAGVARWASPRQVPDLFLIRSKLGNLLLVRQIGKGKRARIEPMFVLKPGVTLQATRYVSKAVEKLEEQAGPIFEAAMEKALSE